MLKICENWGSIIIIGALQSSIKPILRTKSIPDGCREETILTNASDPPYSGLELLF